MKTKISFSVASDLYLAGADEFGQAYHAELFYVVAEHEDGRRWHHPACFHGAKACLDTEGLPYFQDVRAHARKQVYAVLRLVQIHYAEGGDACDFRTWEEAPTAYGSAAYGVLDEYERMDEEERARYF